MDYETNFFVIHETNFNFLSSFMLKQNFFRLKNVHFDASFLPIPEIETCETQITVTN